MTASAQLVFTKGAGKHDRMDVRRDGVVTERIDCPKQGIVPHDMVHYAVESTLQKRGFVTRVMDGEAAAFAMAADAQSDAVERLVEVLQADGWSGWTGPPAGLLELYRVTCDARQCTPFELAPADIEAVRHRLLELTALWQAVPVGMSLTLDLGSERHHP